MADGEYDIFGNPIGAPAQEEVAAPVAAATDAPVVKKKGVGWTPPSAGFFAVGESVEVKEGGNKWRTGAVTVADSKAKTVSVKYDDDGEVEPEIPADLVRRREGASGAAPTPPVEPVAVKPSSGRKDRAARVSKDKVKACLKNPKVVSILEILATLNEKELDAAASMMRALDSVRPLDAQAEQS